MIIRCLILLAGAIAGLFTTVTPAVAQTSFLDSLRLGVLVGLSAGTAYVDPDPDDSFTDSNGVGLTLRISAEKTLSKTVMIFSHDRQIAPRLAR